MLVKQLLLVTVVLGSELELSSRLASGCRGRRDCTLTQRQLTPTVPVTDSEMGGDRRPTRSRTRTQSNLKQ
jgi:hypothetical protein